MSTGPAIPRRTVRTVLVVVLVVLAARFLMPLPWTYPPRSDVDFPAYHEGARLLVSGEIERLYSDEFKEYQNAPVVTLLLAPLGAMSYEGAWHLLWWVNLACIVATPWVLLLSVRRWYGPPGVEGVLLALAVYLAFAPIFHRSLVLGQTTPVLVLAFAAAYAAARRGRPLRAGVWLGLVVLVKIPPAMVIAVLLARRRLRWVAAAAVTLAISLAVSLVVFGIALNLEYVDRVILANASRGLAAFNNQSLLGSLLRILTDRGLTDWTLLPIPAGVRAAHLAALAVVALILVPPARAAAWPPAPPEDAGDGSALELELGLAVALMLLVFPIAWVHYFQFLVVPLTVLPFRWARLGGAVRRLDLALVLGGTILAAGAAVRGGAYYSAFEAEGWFRLLQCSRTLGALLLLIAFARLLAERPGR